MNRRRCRFAVCTCVAASLVASCAHHTGHPGDRTDVSAVAIEPLNGIDNVFRLSDRVWTGGVPEGEAGFDALASLGVRTVIAVDAGVPELTQLHARGMRSIHLPIQYAGLTDEQLIAMSRALRDADGPVYVHCHHGKHRGPAAAAAAMVALGELTPTAGHAFLVQAGTSRAYPGLFDAVSNAGRIEQSEIDAWEGTLLEVAQPGELQQIMSQLESHFDMLDRIATNDWQAFENDPDRSAAAEAGAVHDLLRASQEQAKRTEPGFTTEMNLAVELANRVERAVRSGRMKAADEALLMLGDSCIRCHTAYRRQW